MNNVPFVPRSPAGRKIHDLARRHVRDDHDLRAAVHQALADRRRPAGQLTDDWTRPALDTRRVTPPAADDLDGATTTARVQASTTEAPVSLQDRRWLREAIKFVAAAIVFVLIGTILVLVLRNNDTGDESVIPGEEPATATATSQISPTVDGTAAQQATREALQGAAHEALTATADRAATTTGATATAEANWPLPGDVVARLQVGSNPIGLAVADGSLWVGNSGDGTLMRVDPATHSILATIEIGTPDPQYPTPYYVVSYDNQVWVTDDAVGAVLQIDPASNTVVRTIPLLTADGTGSFKARGLAVDENGIWVSDFFGGRLVNLDPATGGVRSTTAIAGPQHLVSGFGALWIASQDHTSFPILRFDTASSQVVATIPMTGVPAFVTIGADSVWATDETPGTVTRIDPATNSVTATFATGLRATRCIIVASGKVWVDGWLGTGFVTGMVTIDPATLALSRPLNTGSGSGWFMAELDGSIWVTQEDTDELVRIDPTS